MHHREHGEASRKCKCITGNRETIYIAQQELKKQQLVILIIALLQVLWLKDSEEISYSGPRPGVSMITEKSLKTIVTLIIAEARTNDSGRYSCMPKISKINLPIANVSVSVLLGDKTAQLSCKDRIKLEKPRYILVFIILIQIS